MTTLADRLRAAIDETERNAHRFHEQDCDALMGVGGGHGVCDCGEPNRRLRRCAADRKILDAYEHADRMAGSGISPEGNYANGLEFAVREIAEAYGVEAYRRSRQ